MATPATLPTLQVKDIVTISGVVISLAGVAINLLFNVVNYRRTNQVRDDALRLDEFKRLRGPVDSALTAIKGQRNTLRSLEASGGTATQLKKSIEECNKALSEAYNQLEDALSDLDRSQFVHGTNWLLIGSDGWEQVGQAFDSIYARSGNIALMKDGIKKVIVKIDAWVDAVRNQLETQIQSK